MQQLTVWEVGVASMTSPTRFLIPFLGCGVLMVVVVVGGVYVEERVELLRWI